ncbi:Protein root UVB sensitive 3 [Halotydeus destructor]|nr:Protein root UVB sensitive 3 [Halotydeus destructor]
MKKAGHVILSESKGDLKRRYEIRGGKLIVNNSVSGHKSSSRLPLLFTIKQFLISLLLPQGFPNSVSKDYLNYQIWDSVQDLASSIKSTLATYATLKGLGVGNDQATAVAATVAWLLKSGAGMSANIVFAYIQGSKLDADCKRWRLFADILCDIAFVVEIMSPFLTNSFILLQCAAAVLNSLVHVSASATKSALRQHHARNNNFADISAKDGSQKTVVSCFGLIVSACITPYLSQQQNLIFILCSVLVSIHLYANYKLVRSSNLDGFNLNRYGILFEHFIDSGKIMAVEDANEKENIWFFRTSKYDKILKAGVSLQEIATDLDELRALTDIFEDSQYIMNVVNNEVRICYQNNQTEVVFLSVFHALHVKRAMNSLRASMGHLSTSEVQGILRDTRVTALKELTSFKVLCKQKGWDTARLTLVMSDWTYTKSDQGILIEYETV